MARSGFCRENTMRGARGLLWGVMVVFLAACSGNGQMMPYKIDIQQGNAVNQEMVDKLKPGMTKAQARFIMGTPLITDAFHADRWDYVYRYRKGGRLAEERRVTLIFEGDTLKRLEGDVVAANNTKPVSAPAAPGSTVAAEEKGFFGKMWEKIGF
jgi:outer membrane protein assembly factor BamE